MNSEMYEGKHLFGAVRREGPIKNSLHLTLGCRMHLRKCCRSVAAALGGKAAHESPTLGLKEASSYFDEKVLVLLSLFVSFFL